ncbi:MAG: hypothetical protein GY780_02515 [bacterium]|nr:hypothetical protein [bacterium]
MFARAVDSNQVIKDALKNVIFLHNDCEKGEGIEVAKKYNVRGYPTFIMVNADGEVSSSWIGYPGPDKWASYVDAGVKDTRTVVQKKAAYEKDTTKELACSLANSASANYDFAGAVKYFRKARELDPAGARQYTDDILTNMYYGSRGGAFTLDEVKNEADFVMVSSEATAEDKVNVAQMLHGMASQMGEVEAALPYISAALIASEGLDDLADSRLELEIVNALLVEKDTKKALGLKRNSMNDGWQEDPAAINNFAWWCFENSINLEEAKDLALKAVELAPDAGQKANILDTAAEICNAMENCEQAVELMQKAVELNPEKKYFKTQLAKFEEEVQKKNG